MSVDARIDSQGLLNAALEAARAAGDGLRDGFATRSEVRAAEGRDIKIEADLQAERCVLARLRETSPFPVLSEEAGADPGFRSDALHWVVDPLDGTLNYSRSIPLACVSVGLWEGTQPVLGVVHEFLADRTYSGIVGEGSWCNGLPIRVSEISDIGQAVLTTGFPVARDFAEESLLAFVREVRRYKKVRLLGSAALSLAWVAAGHADAYAEDDIAAWDVAAGLAIVRAAGGDIRVEPGSRPWRWHVRASNGHLERE